MTWTNQLWTAALASSAFILLLAAAPGAQADDSLRCGTRLVAVGEGQSQVKSLCGNPDDIQQRVETRTVRRAVMVRCPIGLCQSVVEDNISVVIEDWTYDFGPQRFVQYLTFENGRLLRVNAGSYGRKVIN